MKKTISVITFLFVIGFINAQQSVESVSDLIGTYRWIGRNDTLTLTIANDTTFLLDLPCPMTRSLTKADRLLIGGGMAYTFLAAQGNEVGTSLLEKDQIDTVKGYLATTEERNIELLLPVKIGRAHV